MGSILTAKLVKLRTVGVGEHFSNGAAEKAIQDIDYMVKCIMADKNLPKNCWDIVGEHATLLNACLSPCPTNKEITIYECETGEIPNLDAIPDVGCFAVRYLDKLKKTDFKLSPKNQAGIFVGFATLQETYGSVLMVGENSYVVAKEHVGYVQDHFPLQHEKSANKELEFLHRLLGRNMSKGILTVDEASSQEHTASDPSYSDSMTADVADDDSDGLESDGEVKAVIDQLDESVTQLSSYNPLLFPLDKDVGSCEQVLGSGEQVSENGPLIEGRLQLSQEGCRSSSVNDSGEAIPEITRRSKRQRLQSTSQVNSAEFRALPVQLDDVTAKAPSIDKLSIKQLKENKTLLIGRRIKRHFPGYGGSWGIVISYDADTDLYKLRYGVDGYTEKLAFVDVLKLLPKSTFRQEEDANIEAAHYALAAAAFVVCYANEGKTTKPLPSAHQKFSQRSQFKDVDKAPDKEFWVWAMEHEIETLEKMGCWEVIDKRELPPGACPIGCKWVYKLKFRDGVYDKHRARLVALGYQQSKGRDFFETFSPTCNQVSVRDRVHMHESALM